MNYINYSFLQFIKSTNLHFTTTDNTSHPCAIISTSQSTELPDTMGVFDDICYTICFLPDVSISNDEIISINNQNYIVVDVYQHLFLGELVYKKAEVRLIYDSI